MSAAVFFGGAPQSRIPPRNTTLIRRWWGMLGVDLFFRETGAGGGRNHLTEKFTIGTREATAIGTIILLAKAFLPFFVFLVHEGMSATWLVVLLQIPIAVVGVLVLTWLLQRHPGRTFVEIGDELVGPAVSLFFSILIVVYLLALVGFELRQFSEFLLTAFLVTTPISVVAMAFLLAMAIVAWLGIDIAARLAWLFFFPFLGAMALLLAMTGNLWAVHGLFPVLGPGPGALVKTAFTTLGVGSEVVLLAVIAPFLAVRAIRPVGLASVLIAGFVVLLIMLVALLTFPFPITRELTLSVFEVSRAIDIGRFLVRLETLFMPLWMLTGLIAMTAGLYAAAAVTARALKMPYYRPFVFPMAVLVLAVSFLFPNLPEAMESAYRLLIVWSPVLIGLVLGTLVGLEAWRVWKGKRKKRVS